MNFKRKIATVTDNKYLVKNDFFTSIITMEPIMFTYETIIRKFVPFNFSIWDWTETKVKGNLAIGDIIIIAIFLVIIVVFDIHQVKRYRDKRYRAKQRYRATFFGLNSAR